MTKHLKDATLKEKGALVSELPVHGHNGITGSTYWNKVAPLPAVSKRKNRRQRLEMTFSLQRQISHVVLLVAVTKHLTKSSVEKEGVVLTNGLRAQSTTVRKSRYWSVRPLVILHPCSVSSER